MNETEPQREPGDSTVEVNNRFLMQMIERSGALVFVKDREGRYVLVNQKWEEVTGLSRQEVLGKTDAMLFPGQDGHQFRVNDLEVMASGTVSEREEVLEGGNGPRTFISLKFPLRDESGDACGICGMTTEITLRKRMEEALRRSEAEIRENEERLRLALSAANQGLYDLNVQTGEAFTSPEYARMLGYPPEGFHETNAAWRDRLHPDDLEPVSQAYQDCISGRRAEYRVEFRQRTQSGGWKWILSSGKVVRWDAEGQPLRMLGTHTDISERKHAEAQLAQQLSELQRLHDAMLGRESRVLELKGQVNDLLLQLGQPVRYPSPLSDPGAEPPETGVEPEPVGGGEVALDGTADLREESHSDPGRADALHQRLFDVNPHCMWVYDLETLRFLAVNDAALVRYGYTREEFLGMTLKDIRPMEEVPRLLGSIALSTATVQHSGVWRHRRRNGEILLVEIASNAVVWQGRPARMVVAHDVTARETVRQALEASRRALLSVVEDQRGAEVQVRRLNEQLEQRVLERTAQLEAANQELEAFSYSVSHDLRAPLRQIGSYVDLVRRHAGVTLEERTRRYLETIDDATRQMDRLINDLLSFSRMGRSEIRQVRVPMEDLVRQAAVVAEREAGGREVVWRIDPLPVVEGDTEMLRLVIANLLSNAIKYTQGRTPAVIRIGSVRHARDVVFFVRDNGVGFDMRYVDRLFGVFQRLHSAAEFEGTGIGLANVRRIVSRHGGRTWAEGTVGHGATFFFSLPHPTPDRSR